jgi:2-amino-4-hydroxy-6-hydroxymethyldihydropteridine diphosphokinase
MGRERHEHWGPRLIDIDVIAYEREVIDTPSLKLPHPFAHQRGFVLVPLREIAPEVADWIISRGA